MNLQTAPSDTPLRVLVVNPLTPASKLAITEILVGTIFGTELYIDLILLVYSNEISLAEDFKMELRLCAFANCNSIEVSSDLPRLTLKLSRIFGSENFNTTMDSYGDASSLSDADVFMFITNFPNPNKVNYAKIDSEEYFDTLYLILKVANNLVATLPGKQTEEEQQPKQMKKRNLTPEKKKYKPIIAADGLVTLHILNEICKDLPKDIFFCPTPVPVTVRSILADYLKMEIPKFNHVHAWAADDEVFHFEIEKPLVASDETEDRGSCGKELVGKTLLESFNFDYLQLCDAWIRTDLVEKSVSNLARNPYGSIFRASEIGRALQYIWKSRRFEDLTVYINFGVISDGSLGTIKGLPCVLPLIFKKDTWSVNKHFERDSYLRNEIKRINKRVKEHHDKLIPYCKKFLEDNVIQRNFIPIEEATTVSMTSTNNTDNN